MLAGVWHKVIGGKQGTVGALIVLQMSLTIEMLELAQQVILENNPYFYLLFFFFKR